MLFRRGSAPLTGDVVLCRRLAVQPVKVGVSVCLRGVYPVPHGQALHGRPPRGQAGWRGVVLGADPGKGARAWVGRVAAVARHRGHPGAVAVIHGAHQDLAAAVLRQHGLLGGVRGAAAPGGEVRGAKDGARVVAAEGAASASRSPALAHVRRAAGPQRLLVGGLTFSGGGARAQVGLLGQRGRGRVLETRSGGALANAPVALREGGGMFPFLRSTAGTLPAGVGGDGLQEGRRRGERS